jgi:hypothetical protein
MKTIVGQVVAGLEKSSKREEAGINIEHDRQKWNRE